jgi:hypothetical protein
MKGARKSSLKKSPGIQLGKQPHPKQKPRAVRRTRGLRFISGLRALRFNVVSSFSLFPGLRAGNPSALVLRVKLRREKLLVGDYLINARKIPLNTAKETSVIMKRLSHVPRAAPGSEAGPCWFEFLLLRSP